MDSGESALPDAPDASARPATKKSGRPWWQWVIGCGLILTGVASYVLRWAERNQPDWYLRWAAVDTVPFNPPDGTKTVDHVPVTPGALADYNLLLITLDTTRADRLGYYGHREIETPVLDGLAREGLFFSRAITTAPTTLPSHASILTGQWPYHHGARLNGSTLLADDKLTLAEILREKGYSTAAMVSAYVLDHTFGVAQGFEVYDDKVTHFDDAPVHREAERRGDLTTDQAIAWLKSPAAARKFFLWVHYYDAHGPYEPPGDLAEKYETMKYDGEIVFIDRQIARLLEQLRLSNLRDKTLIAVVGDHGEGLGQHREWTHGLMLYEPTVHVPFILNCPGRIPGGLHVAREVSVVDVMPTLLGMIGVEAPACDGVTLLAPWAAERRIYMETSEGFNQYGLSPLLAVRDGRRKYIYGPSPELYDIPADPDEGRDLAAAEKTEAERMKTDLERLFGADLAKAMNVEVAQNLGTAERDKLAALGYISSGLTAIPKGAELPDPKSVMPIVNRLERILAIPVDGTRAEAIRKLEELRDDHPDFYAVYKHLAILYFEEKEYYLAAAALEQALDIYPDVASNLLLLARAQVLMREYRHAVENYRRAIEVSSDKFTPLAELGRLLLESQQFDRAATELEAALAINPEDALTLEAMAFASQKLGRKDAWVATLRGRIAERPELPETRCALAFLLAADDRHREALELLVEGSRVAGDRPEFANATARIILDAPDRNRFDAARVVAMAEAACKATDSANARYLHTLMLAYAYAGRIAEAVRAGEAALAIADRNRMTRLASDITKALDRLRAAPVSPAS